EPDAAGSFGFVDERIDQCEFSFELLARIGRRSDAHFLADVQHRQFVLVKVTPYPHERKINDVHEWTSRGNRRALRHRQALHDAVHFAENWERLFGLPRLLDLRDLLVGDIPKAQPPFRGFDQPLEIFTRGIPSLRGAIASPQEVDQLALRTQEFRTVNGHQHLIFFDELTDSADPELLHVP